MVDHSKRHPILAMGDTEWAATSVGVMLAGYGPDTEGTDRERVSIPNFVAMKFTARMLYYS